MFRRLLALLLLALVGAVGFASTSTATTTASAAPFTYDVPTVALVGVHAIGAVDADFAMANGPWDRADARSVAAPGTSTIPLTPVVATNTVDDVFRYTSGEFVDSISANGLRPGSYATPNGSLSPLQAQIDLALPPNTGLRDAVMRVDVAGLREAGYEIPSITQVTGTVTGPGGRIYTMPGGGYEMQFPYAIPPEFIKVVTGG